MLVKNWMRLGCHWVALPVLLGLASVSSAQNFDGSTSGNVRSVRGGQQDITTASDESDVRRRARIRLELASAYFSKGELRTALDEVKQVLNIDSDFSEALELRALIYDALNESALASESFNKAIQADPRNGSVLHNHGWYLCRKQQYAKADEQFAKALQQSLSVSPAKTLLARGVCQNMAGQVEAAGKTLLRAYELDPSNPATAYNLARVLVIQGDLQRARFYIRRVNGVPEQANPESLWLGIRIEQKLGNMAERDELAASLRSRFPSAREVTALELGKFDE
jgi:type IV pilus assembly protein PilF